MSAEKEDEKKSWLQNRSYTKEEIKSSNRFSAMFFGFIIVAFAAFILVIYLYA